MNNQQQISMGQLAAILLTSRLAVSMTFAPTAHQLSHGTDFLLSILLQALLLALLLLPTWWFARRSEGISTLDYAVAVMGKGGGAVAVFYGLACLYIQAADLIRFSRFAASTLSPGMSREVLCIVLMVTAGIAAFYGIQAIAARRPSSRCLWWPPLCWSPWPSCRAWSLSTSRPCCSTAARRDRGRTRGAAPQPGAGGARPADPLRQGQPDQRQPVVDRRFHGGGADYSGHGGGGARGLRRDGAVPLLHGAHHRARSASCSGWTSWPPPSGSARCS